MKEKDRIVELDALRGLAALLVVIFHFSMGNLTKNFLVIGVTGVDLFFIISGFVIMLTVEKVSSWKDFVVNRSSRLFPVYWTCVTLTAGSIFLNNVLTDKSSDYLLSQYLINLTMFQHYFQVPNIDGPYWTLIIELIFYAFMLLIFQMNQLHRIENICYILLVPILFYSTFLQNFSPNIYKEVKYLIPLINHFPLFFSGILFYKIKFDSPKISRHFGLILCFILQILLFDDGGLSRLFIPIYAYIGVLLIYFGAFYFFAYNLLNFIVNKVTVYLGAISYSLYLIHQFLGCDIIIPFFKNHMHLNVWIVILFIALPTVLLLASIITFYIEKPSIKYIRSKFGRKAGPSESFNNSLKMNEREI
jgi:peptidoglycan/LPS O-acetylase OafA/YrhL